VSRRPGPGDGDAVTPLGSICIRQRRIKKTNATLTRHAFIRRGTFDVLVLPAERPATVIGGRAAPARDTSHPLPLAFSPGHTHSM
jgi:hypothetical protein